MKSETILEILLPKIGSEFIVLKTVKSYYELRMGGYRTLTKLDDKKYNSANEPSWLNKKIKKVLSDDYMMYIENENGDGFSYGFTNVNGNGKSQLSLCYINNVEFKEVFNQLSNDEDFIEI